MVQNADVAEARVEQSASPMRSLGRRVRRVFPALCERELAMGHYRRAYLGLRLLVPKHVANAPLRFGETAPDEDIAAHLDAAAAAWEAGEIPLPRFCVEQSRAAALPGRILILVSRYILNNPACMENEQADHFLETARSAGIDADVFWVDDCSYPTLGRTAHGPAALQALRERIEEFRPDALLFDAGFIGTERTLNARFLSEMRARYGVHVIAAMLDAWNEDCVKYGEYWYPACDTIYHFSPVTPLTGSGARDKLVWAAFPVNSARYHAREPKDISANFVGSAVGPRAFLVAAAASLRLPNAYFLVHKRKRGALTLEDYAALMRRSQIVLNFSAPYPARITGRSWQALHCGALLLEEANDLISAYFAPYVHYVPFRSASELRRLLKYFAANPGRASSIADRGAAWVRERYGELDVWAGIVSRLGKGASRGSGIAASLRCADPAR